MAGPSNSRGRFLPLAQEQMCLFSNERLPDGEWYLGARLEARPWLALCIVLGGSFAFG